MKGNRLVVTGYPRLHHSAGCYCLHQTSSCSHGWQHCLGCARTPSSQREQIALFGALSGFQLPYLQLLLPGSDGDAETDRAFLFAYARPH